MFTFAQAKYAIGSALTLNDEKYPCTSIDHSTDVKVNIWEGSGGILKQITVQFDPQKIGQGYIGGQVLDLYWRCLQIKPDVMTLSQLLDVNGFNNPVGGFQILKTSTPDNWHTISANTLD